jgi:hypothetical protein
VGPGSGMGSRDYSTGPIRGQWGKLRYIPVVLRKQDEAHCPVVMRRYSYFLFEDEARYRDLCQALQRSAAKPGRQRGVRNIPLMNPLFCGRDEYLDTLRKALVNRGSAALTQAIQGLGGIGKTQTAIESPCASSNGSPRFNSKEVIKHIDSS